MEVRCPQCHTPIDPGDESLTSELVCVGCGGTFSLAGEEETFSLRDGKPRTVGHFELLERIGAGSFGAVWRARDKELDRTVAVKIPRKGDLDSEGVQRFLREAQAAAQLRHPNIVSVHEVGREDDTLYIVSDFIRGPTLKERLGTCCFTPHEACDMCVQIADGLDHAHSAGVVHRDLKPGNILLDDEGMPHIVDFGLASRDVGEVTMTLEGRVFGTPAYAPPEQARGDASQADRRSDVYSLGVVLFEVLTGERPFRGNVQMVLQHVIQDDAPSPRSFNGNVPRDLETICLKCLEKSPGKRYQTAGNLRDDMKRYLDGIPIHARPVSSVERGKKWIGRHPTISLLTTCIVLITITAVTAISWQWRKAVAAQKNHARVQIDLLLNAEPEVVPSVVSNLDDFRVWVDPPLKELLSGKDLSKKHRFRVHLALLPMESESAEYLSQELLAVNRNADLAIAELINGAEALREFRSPADEALWEVLEDQGQSREQRVRAALILVRLQGNAPSEKFQSRFAPLASSVVDGLLELSVTAPSEFPVLVEAMRPASRALLQPLEQRILDDQAPESLRSAATSFFGEYVGSDFDRLTSVLLRVKGEQYMRLLAFVRANPSEFCDRLLPLISRPSDQSAEEGESDLVLDQRASAIVTLMHLGHAAEQAWELLEPSDDMRLRSFLTHRFAELRLPQQVLVKRILWGLQTPTESAGVLRALILSLGEYRSPAPYARQTLMAPLIAAYRRHPDSGTHSSIALLLKRWGHADTVETMRLDLAGRPAVEGGTWFVNSEAITMAVIRDPPVFLMGSEESEPNRDPEERLHWRKIDRTFAIGTTEITANQFLRYANSDRNCGYTHDTKYGPDPDGPAIAVTWLQAAKYCRWLSEIENVPKDQMCFPEISEITEDMIIIPKDYLSRTGYRLPTDGEWEYACREGTVTVRFFGNSDELVGKYGWYIKNCDDRTWGAGKLLPNGLGLFDVYGNVWEWCVDRYGKLPITSYEAPYVDVPKTERAKGYVLRGGSMTNRASVLRSAERDMLGTGHHRNHNVGFRIARTVPDD